MDNPDRRQPAMSDSGSAMVARLPADEASARHIAETLSRDAGLTDAAASAFEDGAGWAVEICLPAGTDMAAARALLANCLGSDLASGFAFHALDVKDWVSASLEGLKPVDAGRFVIHGSHDRGHAGPNRIAIEIEAALAFGTGHHGTTRGCLLALGSIAKRSAPARILDVGTGSGVLAIAAARLLRRNVLASDIDREAVAAAAGNARLNRAAALVETLRAPGLASRRFRERAPYDLVFANILLEPLKKLARPLALLLAPGGRAVLSGLLAAHAPAAIAAYRAQGLVLESRREIEGWATLVMRRSPKRQRPGPFGPGR